MERIIVKIKKRVLNEKGQVVENKKAIKEENMVINAVVKILSTYVSRKLTTSEKDNIVELVETL